MHGSVCWLDLVLPVCWSQGLFLGVLSGVGKQMLSAGVWVSRPQPGCTLACCTNSELEPGAAQ